MAVTSSDQNGAYRHEPGGRPPATARRPRPGLALALAWAVPFGLVLTVLLIRNAFLWGTPEYEDADMGANSILIEQARRFTLLVGNYSRERFSHPGPAFLYVQSWGESLLFDTLHVVPAPWNGQLIALYALSAAFAASVVGIGYGWSRSARGAAVTLAAVMALGALHPSLFSSDWMPYEYVPAYFAFVVAIASVAAGRTGDAPIAALAGWFLIHGHACFLLFVPVLVAAALAAAGWSRGKTRNQQAERTLLSPPAPRVWVPVAVISGVFALPIALELALHWPGNFGRYFAYSSSSRSGGHGAAQVASYVLWFWWPHPAAGAALAALVAIAVLLTWRSPAGPVRRFCWSLLAVDALSTVAFAGYTAVGVDVLSQYYIGYFYWSAPVIVVLVIGLSLTGVLSSPPGTPARAPVRTPVRAPRALGRARRDAVAITVAAVAAAAATAAFAVAPQTRLDLGRADPANPATGPVTDPSLPSAVAAMARSAAGRPAVLAFPHDAWPEVTGILVQAERTGVPACVARPGWEFMMTSQFICTPAERAEGRVFHVYEPGQVARGAVIVARLRRGVVTAGGK